jgi:glucosamine kinase
VVGAGGQLVHQPLLATRLRAVLAATGINDVRILDRDPVHGAVVLALAEEVVT